LPPTFQEKDLRTKLTSKLTHALFDDFLLRKSKAPSRRCRAFRLDLRGADQFQKDVEDLEDIIIQGDGEPQSDIEEFRRMMDFDDLHGMAIIEEEEGGYFFEDMDLDE
jgi:hypothetical protein